MQSNSLSITPGHRHAATTPNESVVAANVRTESALNPEHAQNVKSTRNHNRTEKCIKDHNGRINQIQSWIEVNYPDVYNNLCIPLTDEQKSETIIYYKGTHEFKYDQLESIYIEAFISNNQKKLKRNGEEIMNNGQPVYKSYTHLRKYSDAIKFGSERSNIPLSRQYLHNMKVYLDNLKKENIEKKSLGQVDEREADPITTPFFRAICEAAINFGWITIWCWTVLQWHCMARSYNIAVLNFNSFKVGVDSIIIKFCKTKKDPKGENLSPKNCYSNPFNYAVCVTTALGCYLAISDDKFAKGRKNIFKTERCKKDQSPGHTYCDKLVDLFNVMGDSIYQWVRPGHANGHGIRKGASVAVTSSSTCPPAPSSVARRGEWSLGKVFDIYWKWAEAGDQYCGRILAGLDPQSTDFAALPPHFIAGIEDEHINKAMELNFKNTYKMAKSDNASNMIAILLRCLASIVHHSDSLLQVISSKPSHPFTNIPILTLHPELLQILKTKVTTKPSQIIPSASGIPPHTKQMLLLKEVADFLKEERQERLKLEERLERIVNEAIEKNAASNGHITAASLRNTLTEHKKSMEEYMDSKLDALVTMVSERRGEYHNPVEPEFEQNAMLVAAPQVVEKEVRPTYLWAEDGEAQARFWYVPKNFDFPKPTLFLGFQQWMRGLPNFRNVDGTPAPIMPYHKLKCDNSLPSKLKIKLRGEWKPIMKKLLSAPNLPAEYTGENKDKLTHEELAHAYSIGMEYLQSQVPYIFSKSTYASNSHTWKVSQWSKMIKPSEIKKNGTEVDIANLPPPTHHNRKRKRNQNS